MSSPSNFATPSQTQTRTKPPNTSQSPSASKGIPSPVDVAEVVSLQFRNIPMTGSFPFSESTVGSALRQALACYLSTPTSSLAVGSVLIDSVKLASTGSLLGERFKPGQAANLPPARPGCLAPSIAPPARRLAEELTDAAAAGGRALQDATEPQPSPRSDLVVNVELAVTLPARDGAFANSVRRELILAAKETPEGRAALSRFLLVCGFYDALAAYDPGMPVTALADAGTFVAATQVQPSTAPPPAAGGGGSNIAAVAGGITAAVIVLAVLGGGFYYLKLQQANDPAAQLHNQASFAKAPKAEPIEMGAGLTGAGSRQATVFRSADGGRQAHDPSAMGGGMNPAYSWQKK